jgi:sterol desaturase/sphingolipid hydroxylase (fatty acid hydroxylase superfamily)
LPDAPDAPDAPDFFQQGIAMELNLYKLGWMLPILVTIAMIEGLLLQHRFKRAYDWRENFASLGVAIGQRLSGFATAGLMSGLYFLAWDHRFFTIKPDGVWNVLLLVLGVEFFYYWHHRLSHESRWFWASHVVHHSAQHLTLAASYRLGWTAVVSGAGLFYLPLVLLGFHPLAVFAALGINLLYQFWLHNEWTPKLGPVEWIFNTPSHHRVHHAINPQYLDRNYGGLLVIYDRLFGTLVIEDEREPCRYGLVRQINSYNPLRIAFNEWIEIVRDVRGAHSLRAVLGYLFGPPGWSADGSRKTSAMLRAEAALPAIGLPRLTKGFVANPTENSHV